MLWPRMDPELEGAKQKTPLNINRFVLLVVSLVYTSTSACVYFDWSAIRNLLLDADKYKHLNPYEFDDRTLSPQYHKLNNLYPVTLAIHFTMSVFCGFLYDHIGPKLTAVLGQLFNITSWIFFSINSTKFDTTLFGFILLGLGADTAFIPVLTFANLFPDASTFVLTLIGAAASLSFAVPVTLNIILRNVGKHNFTYVCYGYILVILMPCILSAIFLFPYRPFKGVDDFERERGFKDSEISEEKNNYDNMYLPNAEMDKQPRIMDGSDVNVSSGVEMETMKSEKASNANDRKELGEQLTSKMENKSSMDRSSNVRNRKETHNHPDNKYDLIIYEKLYEDEIEKNFHRATIKLFFRLLITFPSICIISYFIIFNISMVFYGMVNEIYFKYDKNVGIAINVMFPLSCIPCVIFGRLVNRFGTAAIMLAMNGCSALMHALALIKHTAAGMSSAFFNMCAASMYTSQIYCFVQNAYPTVVFGKIIGFASLCGGIFSLFSHILYHHVISMSKSKTLDPSPIAVALVISFVLLFIPLYILYKRNYERLLEADKSDSHKDSIKEMKEKHSIKV